MSIFFTRFIGVLLLVAASALIPALAQDLPDPSRLQIIDRFLQLHLDENPVPGFSVVVVIGDRIVFEKGYGVRVLGETARVTKDSPIGIGSQTKSFTAVAAMQLVEQGKLELDAPVVRYLPWFRTADRRGGEVTVRMLLNNTSGIPSVDRWLTSSDRSEAAAERSVRQLSSVALVRRPGESFEYANENWTVLGLLISELSGMPYSTYMQRHVFDPMGMSRTTTALDLFDEKEVLYGHYTGLETARPARPRFLAEALAAGSEMRASAGDMGRYLITLLNGGNYRGQRILSPESVDLIFEPGVRTSMYMAEIGAMGEEAGYAMGWVESEVEGRMVHQHGGDAIVMTSWTMLDREAGIGASVLYNGPTLDAYRHPSKTWLVHNLLRLVEGKRLSDFGRPREADPLANDYELPTDLLERYVGDYLSQAGLRARIELDETEKRLIVTAGSLDLDYIYEVDFANESVAVLRNMSGGTAARFLMTPAGEVTGIEGGLFGGLYRRENPEQAARRTEIRLPDGSMSFVLPDSWEWKAQDGSIEARSADGANQLQVGFRADDWSARRQQLLGSSAGEIATERTETIGPWVWNQVILDNPGESSTQMLVASAEVGLRRFEIALTTTAGDLTRQVRDVLLPLLGRLKLEQQ